MIEGSRRPVPRSCHIAFFGKLRSADPFDHSISHSVCSANLWCCRELGSLGAQSFGSSDAECLGSQISSGGAPHSGSSAWRQGASAVPAPHIGAVSPLPCLEERPGTSQSERLYL